MISLSYLALAAAAPTMALSAGEHFVVEREGAEEGAHATAEHFAEPLPVTVKYAGNAILPANTEVLLRTNQEVTTKGKTWEEGDTFVLSVVHDVILGDYVIIPAGSAATGRITWLTNKGMFGKSGKMDIEIEYVTVKGRRIELDGTYRQEGEGNTVATVAGVVAVPIAGLFITGRSGRIPEGRELLATTEFDVELALAANEVVPSETPLAPSGLVQQDWPVEDPEWDDEPDTEPSELAEDEILGEDAG